MTPERLGVNGPNFPDTSVVDTATLIAASNLSNANGVVTLAINDSSSSNITTVVLSSGANAKVKPGQFVLMVDDNTQVDDSPAMVIDGQTPTPIYDGPNAAGVKVSKVDGANVTLEGHGNTSFSGLSPASQALIFIDEHHGAGGMDPDGLEIAAGVTIYGRWTKFQQSSTAHVICYFGK